MLADDQPEYPMTFILRVTLNGVLNRSRFEDAIHKTLPRHPLLQVHFAGDISRPTAELFWQPVQSIEMPDLYWREGDRLSENTLPALDLRRQIGARFVVDILGQKQTVISLQIHHAISDGAGAVQFFEDIFTYYGNQGELRTLKSELLPRRGEFHQTKKTLRTRFIKDMQRALLFFRRFPKAIGGKPVSFVSGSQHGLPGTVTWELSQEEFQRLRETTRQKNGSLNDLLLRDCFVGIDEWHQKLYAGKRAPNIRLAMPINMRRNADHHMSVANVVSMCFLDRRPGEIRNPERLLRSIVSETEYIKNNYMGFALIRFMRDIGGIKHALKLMLVPRLAWKCFATAVLSNLGEPLRHTLLPRDKQGRVKVGELTIERIEIMPPVRPHTYVTFGAVTYNNALTITMRYAGQHLDQLQSETILAFIKRRIQATISGVRNEVAA